MTLSKYIIPGLHCQDHEISVPLDWSKPDDGRKITVFAREVVDPARRGEQLPMLAFLQGGPGGKSPRPANSGSSWLMEALKTHRVILIDQRGTGRSTRIESATMEQFSSPQEGADYLACFRADSIVRDCEAFRKTTFGGAPWETLGQSYGGFLTMTYLSLAPEGLSACYVAGGLPSLNPSADEVYRRTFPRVEAKTERYYKRYPDDRARIGQIADFIASNEVLLPDGDRLSGERFQTIGIDFGMQPGFENVHWLVDEAFSSARKDRLSDVFLASVMAMTSYDSNPLFAVLQESIYGQADGATAWAAERMRNSLPQFSADRRPLLFTGEMMFPWMFEEIRSLRPFKAAADALAQRPTYGMLYDAAKLALNEVPVAAIIYHDDMYVDAELSLETAKHVGNLQHWVTNQYEHDGIRQDPDVFKRLVSMVRDSGGPLLR